MQGFMGMMLLFLAKNAQLIDPMNDARRNGANPMAVPFLDNGLSVVTKANADDFYWDKYLARRGTKGINE
jgi:ribose transport system substrate-binding protein